MSRIIIKGLPIFLTDDKLKDHFNKRLIEKYNISQPDLITDCKILRDRKGNSRRFAFIGYKNEEDAFDAINYFNGTYINTSKLEVSMAKSFADPRVPQSMKERKREAYKRMREREEKLLEEEQNKSKKHNNKKAKIHDNSIDAEIAKNKQLQEFIETMKPSSKITSWETAGITNNIYETEKNSYRINSSKEQITDGSYDGDKEIQGNSLLAHALAMQDNNNNNDDENMERILDQESDGEYEDFNAKKGNETNKQEEEPMMTLDQVPINEVNNNNKDDDDQDNLARDEQISDLDWFKQRRVRIREGEDAPVENGDTKGQQTDERETVNDEDTSKEPTKSPEEIAIKKIKETGRLFLRNILYTSTEKDFENLFSPFGQLEEVHIALDTRTGKSKGFGYILFKNPDDAVQAYIELDKQIFQGRLLHILPADSKKSHRLDEFDLKNMPLKKQRELKRKANASKQTFSWNSLYMNQNAVLSSVANRLGVQKSELLDPENSSSAVKQALAEAHVIGDVRKYFEEKGVDLLKFQQLKDPKQRDDTVILIKNFPYSTTIEELSDLFLPFGKLERFLMPPAGTIAIVQYRDVTSARAAFTKLAYKRFKDGILYLEKGPKDCFTRAAKKDESVKKDSVALVESKLSIDDIMEGKRSSANPPGSENISNITNEDVKLYNNNNKDDNKDVDDDDDTIHGPTVSIFIKNLNFSTTTAQLNDRFKNFNGFVVAQVKTKPDGKHPGKTLSMGFGFAEFRTKEQANAVIAAMDGEVIDGHRIQLKLSHRLGGSNNANNNSNTNDNSKRKIKSGKIIVKNLPFEATRKDVFELFNSFGQLKSVRVPKKFDKSARGFAFVEFLLPKEAENAIDQLQGVHLLGRRLVIQYAESDAVNAEEEIARMTKKVRKQVATKEISLLRENGGRRKLDMEESREDEADY